MTRQTEPQNQHIQPASIAKPMLVGAGVALLAISFYVIGVDAPHPEWGRFWFIRPLVITPLAGAVGGAFYSLMNYQSAHGFNRTLAIVLSIAVYIVGLFLGIVLGLDGTMWD